MIWKETQYRGYFISDSGMVMSTKTVKTGKILSQQTDKDEYKTVHFYDNSKSLTIKVHRLVAEAFIENPLKLEQVNHKNGDKSDNAKTNLEWSTNIGNQKHRWKNDIGNFKLSVEQVRDIKTRISKGERNIDISRFYQVDRAVISHIKHGKRWAEA